MRWIATVNYRSSGISDLVFVEFEIEELDELQTLIELGPDWNCIDSIVVKLARINTPGMCLEDIE